MEYNMEDKIFFYFYFILEKREIFNIREIFDRGDDFNEVNMNRSVYLEKEKSTTKSIY